MKEFNPQKDCLIPKAALNAMDLHKQQRRYPAFIGLDVHKGRSLHDV